MDSLRESQIATLLHTVSSMPAEERDLYLRAHCEGDPDLLNAVQTRLASHGPIFSSDTASLFGTGRLGIHPEMGQEIGGYRFDEMLGQGGMGMVYRVQNTSLDRTEALKVITPSLTRNEDLLRRFRLEARAMARIHHPNIVTVFALGHSAVGHHITMEYVEGQTLAEIIRDRGAMRWQQAVPLIKQLLAAFQFAHERGILHRDIKPHNIMMTADGTVKVMDFGLVKFYEQDDATRTMTQSGTLAYMSPEQIKGNIKLDQRSDLFSIGMTLYELLTGRLPFDKDSGLFAVQLAIVERAFPPLTAFNPDIPAPLERFIMTALAKDREDRYRDAQEMLVALEACEAEIKDGASIDARKPRREPLQNAAWFRYAAIAAGLLLLAGAVYGVVAVLPAAEQRQTISEHARVPEATAQQDAPPTLLDETALADAATLPSENTTTEETPTEETPSATAEARPPAAGASPTTAEAEPRRTPLPQREQEPARQEATPPAQEETPGLPAARTEPEATPETTAAREQMPDEATAATPEEEPEPVDPLTTLEDVGYPLMDQLERAILQNDWASVPAPLRNFYQPRVEELYKNFNLVAATFSPQFRDLQVMGGQGFLQVNLHIDYTQKGRGSGRKSVPLPATWIWEANGHTARVIDVGSN